MGRKKQLFEFYGEAPQYLKSSQDSIDTFKKRDTGYALLTLLRFLAYEDANGELPDLYPCAKTFTKEFKKSYKQYKIQEMRIDQERTIYDLYENVAEIYSRFWAKEIDYDMHINKLKKLMNEVKGKISLKEHHLKNLQLSGHEIKSKEIKGPKEWAKRKVAEVLGIGYTTINNMLKTHENYFFKLPKDQRIGKPLIDYYDLQDLFGRSVSMIFNLSQIESEKLSLLYMEILKNKGL